MVQQLGMGGQDLPGDLVNGVSHSHLVRWAAGATDDPPAWFERHPRARYLLAHFWLDDRGME